MVESINEEKIMIELKNFNFKRNSLSYEYLIDTIKIVANDRMVMRDFLKYVYRPVADRYKTSPKNVLWCISKLINLMYFNTNEEIIEDYFKVSKNNKPSTKAFIIGVEKNLLNMQFLYLNIFNFRQKNRK